jgi:acetoin utilization deacetylase AcuC-like enzyme
MQKMFDTILLQLAGSYLACRLAMECDTKKFCFYLNGGNHHARYDYGAGFCLLNDVIIAARKMQAEKRAKLVWIIDVDAHKGCGSAELVAFIRKGANPHGFEDGAEIITLSAHMAQGWPLDDETLVAAKKRFDADFSKRAPFIAADVEIPVESGEEDRYTTLLAQGLQQCVALSGGRNADLAIVVDGADPYEHDGLESSNLLRLTLEQCVERDTCIYDFLQQRQIPSAWILAGGYGERAWEVPAAFLGLLEKKQTENRNKT